MAAPNGHVKFHPVVFGRGERTGFEKDLVRDGNLANVVERGRELDVLDLVAGQSQFGGEPYRQGPDPLSVPAGRVIAVFAGDCEPLEDLSLRGGEFSGSRLDPLLEQGGVLGQLSMESLIRRRFRTRKVTSTMSIGLSRKSVAPAPRAAVRAATVVSAVMTTIGTSGFIRSSADMDEEGEAIDVGHVEVQQDQVRIPILDHVDGTAGIRKTEQVVDTRSSPAPA